MFRVTELYNIRLNLMKLFKNVSLASKNVFSPHSSFFYRPIALLCDSKKASIGVKILSL